jgi:DNA helicase-4
MQNPEQRKKKMRTLTKVEKPAVSLLRQSKSEGHDPILRVLEHIVSREKAALSLYLLARYNFILP